MNKPKTQTREQIEAEILERQKLDANRLGMLLTIAAMEGTADPVVAVNALAAALGTTIGNADWAGGADGLKSLMADTMRLIESRAMNTRDVLAAIRPTE